MEEISPIIDRDQLRIERKLRKKLKKEQARTATQKEREKIALQKLRSTDSRIQIVAENPFQTQPTQCSCENATPDDLEQFPALSLSLKQKKRSVKRINHCDSCHLNKPLQNNGSKKRNSSITIDIAETIAIAKKPTVVNKNVRKSIEPRILHGNMLDSDKPQRRHGKVREYKQKHESPLKKQINREKNCMALSENKLTFCDNIVAPELNSTVERLLKDLADFYYRQYDPLKTMPKNKKRFVVGFHEIEKYIPTKNVKLIIFAANIQAYDALYERINKFKNLTKAYDVPYGFALSRRQLSRCLRKQTPISCVAILNYFGSESNYHKTIELLKQTKMEYETSIAAAITTTADESLPDAGVHLKIIETLETIDLS